MLYLMDRQEKKGGVESGTQDVNETGGDRRTGAPDNIVDGNPPDGKPRRNGAKAMPGMVEVNVDELVDLKSKAKAFDDMKSQKADVNSKNVKLKEAHDKVVAERDELASQVSQFKESGLDPKEFDVLKNQNEELKAALEARTQEASKSQMELLGIRYGVRDDEDCMGIFASKYNAAKAEANGDFDPGAFAESLKSEKSFLFGAVESGNSAPPKTPRRTPGGKGTAASSGGSELEAQLNEVNAAMERLKGQGGWVDRSEMQSLKIEKQMIENRLKQARKGA